MSLPIVTDSADSELWNLEHARAEDLASKLDVANTTISELRKECAMLSDSLAHGNQELIRLREGWEAEKTVRAWAEHELARCRTQTCSSGVP